MAKKQPAGKTPAARKPRQRKPTAKPTNKPSLRLQEAFLAAFAESAGNVAAAARAVGIDRGDHYRWLRIDPTYAERLARVQDVADGALKDEARFRALIGLRRYKFDKNGDPILHPETGEPYYEDVRSDTLLLAMLNARFPDEFRYRTETKHAGTIDVTQRVNFYLPENSRQPKVGGGDE